MKFVLKYPALFLSNDGKTEFMTNAVYATDEDAIADNLGNTRFIRLVKEYPGIKCPAERNARVIQHKRGAA